MCPEHLDSEMGLCIAPSLIPNAGYGLFATRDFAKGNDIVPYTGDIILTLDDDVYWGRYVLQVKSNVYIDAKDPVNTAGFINSPRGTNKKTNCQFVYNPRTKVAWVRATKKIKAGDELLVGYSSGYWRHYG